MSDFGSGCQLSSHVAEPTYNGYQLIGDNQFLRFSENLLNIKCKKANGLKFSGLCVRDQKIIDLLRRIHIGFCDISEKVVLMIGTNDLLRGTSFEAMCEDFKELLNLLCKVAKKIILLTVPPVLKLKDNKDHWIRLKRFNDFIRQCRDDEKIFVGDAYAQFVISKESPLDEESCTGPMTSANGSSSLQATPIRFSKWLLTSMASDVKVCRRVKPSPSLSNLKILPPPPGIKLLSPAQGFLRSFPFVSNELPGRKFPAKANHSRSCESTPTHGSKWLWTNETNGGKMCYQVSASSPNLDKLTPPSKRLCEALPSSIPIQDVKTDQNMGRRRPSSFDPNSFDAAGEPAEKRHCPTLFERWKSCETLFTRRPPKLVDSSPVERKTSCPIQFPSRSIGYSQPPAAKRVSTQPPERRNLSWTPFFIRSIGTVIPVGPIPSGCDDLSMISSRRVPTPKEKDDFSHPTVSSAGDDSASTSSGIRTSQVKCNSHLIPRPPSCGNDDLSTARKRKAPFERNFNSYSLPTVFGDNKLPIELPTLEERRNSCSRARDNPNGSYSSGRTREVDIENADKIREECFEMCLAGDSRQPDLIHLNMRGLCALRGIIQGIIDILDENYS